MRGGHLALAEMLLESGVEQNVFTLAAMGDVAGLARRLDRVPADARLAASMEPACQQVTALHVGCASDWRCHGQDRLSTQVGLAKTLAEHGADVGAVARYRGLDGATPLFCACWSSGNRALVQWLLDQGATAHGGCLLAALGHFQRHGKEAYDIAEALLAWGLPVDGGIPGARTPLHTFAHQGTQRTVAWLIAHGADVNARGPGGRTAAHFAAERNTGFRTLAMLVDQGADLTARDDDGQTPLETAKRNGKVRLVEWLTRRVRAKEG
jgi:ankyrin repeat protein